MLTFGVCPSWLSSFASKSFVLLTISCPTFCLLFANKNAMALQASSSAFS